MLVLYVAPPLRGSSEDLAVKGTINNKPRTIWKSFRVFHARHFSAINNNIHKVTRDPNAPPFSSKTTTNHKQEEAADDPVYY